MDLYGFVYYRHGLQTLNKLIEVIVLIFYAIWIEQEAKEVKKFAGMFSVRTGNPLLTI